MIIEIRKAGFINKGAELMLYAILQRVKQQYPNAKFCMVPAKSAIYEDRIKLDLYQKAHLWRKGFDFAWLFHLIPKKIRKQYGIVLDKEVDIVLDASGFSYSDQINPYNTYELFKSVKKWKRNNTKVILLPQAFGPFKNKTNRYFMKKSLDKIDFVFAREENSFNYLKDLKSSNSSIKTYPDFTNLINGKVPTSFDQENNKFCIIPNYRMIQKTSEKNTRAYLPFLVFCIQYLQDKGQKPFILIHDLKNDMELANKINEKLVNKVMVVTETDPLNIKGIIGASEGIIGSRFHGLVSALSQGIPTLATGWSHKYKMLFNDYNFQDGLLDVSMDQKIIKSKIDLITDTDTKKDIKQNLLNESERLKKLSEDMWQNIFKVVEV